VVSFWLVIVVAFLRAYRDTPDWLTAGTLAVAAGLSLLTKGVAWAFLPALGLAFLFMLPRASMVSLLGRAPPLGALAILINVPQALRARDLTGSLLGAPFPDAGPFLGYPVAHKTFAGMLANCLRNFADHLSVHNAALNRAFERIIRGAIAALGQDPDDPGAVFQGLAYGDVGHFKLPPFRYHEVVTGNFVTVFLLLAAMGWALWRWRRQGQGDGPREGRRDAALCCLGIAAGFAFFSLMLRWQIWGSRFHLPLFVIGAAPIGLFLEARSSRVQVGVAAVLFAWALLMAVANDTRALLPPPLSKLSNVYHPRAELYYGDGHGDIVKAQMDLARAANQTGCSNAAFDLYHPRPDAEMLEGPASFYVYPLMAQIQAAGGGRRVWFEGVRNMTAKYADAHPHPPACMVICLSCADQPEKFATYGRNGLHASVFGNDVLFAP